ncbi:MBL fold metallo-hydrolase [Pedobacter zeae]|uniref:Glyoxylase-like metal-dependent hydrolase (Beta-lactamase superfamily II) n=1 Tax=Pedobacter zeae TaxID=1737356 RepID=A0A7W6K8X7_9SPHI|nr:MBL fold metallo-hydrolase [Pedobacter zeae]MBB4107277.1 glyoxylase-like metal-dependent hydrolase (beta-lactamase superfamily II) [Pedobacter zeae]GGH06834.1 MBL fold metallo-hydrolase [Pedobacter zeae]
MNRRTLLKSGCFVAAASLIPPTILGKTLAKKEISAGRQPAGFRKLKLGELDLFVLSDGYIRDTNVADYSPRADVARLKSILKNNFRPVEYIDMAMNILLVKTNDKLILFDSGMGIFADANTGKILKSLAEAGFSPSEITDIFISHAHPDHIGGLIGKNGTLIYPNAKHHLSKTEFDFWMRATEKDFQNSGLIKQLDFLKTLLPAIRNILTKIQSKISYYDYQKPLYGNFSFISAPGHTPGMTLVKITSGNDELLVVADLVHNDLILFPHPEWGFSGDTDLDIAIASRKKILNQLAETKTRIIGYHLPWPGLGYVKKTGDGLAWVQEVFYTPT